MKTLRILLGFLVLVGISFTLPTHKAEANIHGVSFQVFYDGLMPYGNWVMDQRHGYVWIPNVGPDFHPYGSNGHWMMTTYGNTWVSHYDWGWAPFHYGRWFFDDFYGWAWVPGYEWGPAWVSWRTGGGYYGWAPLGPGLSIHVGFNVIPNRWYVFVPQRRFVSRNIWRYYVPRTRVVNIYNQTTIINNTYVNNRNVYVSGPDRRDIERATRSRVPVYQVGESNRPGRASVANNRVSFYRPEIDRNTNRNTQARPARVASAQEVSRGRNQSNHVGVNGTNNRVNSNNASRAGSANSRNEGTINNRTSSSDRNQAIQNNRSANAQASQATRGRTNEQVGTTNRSTVNSRPQVNNRTSSSPQVNSRSNAVNQTRPQGNVSRSSSNNQRSAAAKPARSNSNQRNAGPSVRSGSSNRNSQSTVRSSSGSSNRSSGTTRSSSRSNTSRRGGS